MDELLEQFVIEGRELVQQLSDDLMALERAPGDATRLDRLFRCVHTLKGSAAIFDLAPMVGVLHAAEDRLDAARRASPGEALPPAVIDAMLDVVGRCDDWIGAIAAAGGALPPQTVADAARLLAALSDAAPPAPGPAAAAALPDWAAQFRDEESEALAAALAAGAAVTALRYAPPPDCFFLGDDPLALLRALPGMVALRLATAATPDGFDPFRCALVATAASTAPLAELKAAVRFHADQVAFAALTAPSVTLAGEAKDAGVAPATAAADASSGERAGSLRVATARLDGLIEGVGELLAVKNALAGLLRSCAAADPSLAGQVARAAAALDRQVAETHHRALGLRLVPLSGVFGRLPRLVRETASSLGKRVDLAVAGGEIEIDKAVADALFEPLLHLLRNAVDHGIESPDRRRTAGKPDTGRVRLEAERVAGGIAITVADDGGGIDAAGVRDAAVARGLLDASATLDRAATLDLLFAPGFSTARAVTGVSGRGVGLDAVRAAVAALGGTVALRGERGGGSSFRLDLPQRAAIAPVMLVRAGGERWGVPADAVSEVLRPAPGSIVEVRHGRATVHRERTLAVLDLAALVGEPGGRVDPPGDGGEPRLLVTRVGAEEVGLVVAAIEGRADVLLRPCAGLLAASRLLQGTAVLGDGGVLMVLDPAALTAAWRERGAIEGAAP